MIYECHFLILYLNQLLTVIQDVPSVFSYLTAIEVNLEVWEDLPLKLALNGFIMPVGTTYVLVLSQMVSIYYFISHFHYRAREFSFYCSGSDGGFQPTEFTFPKCYFILSAFQCARHLWIWFSSWTVQAVSVKVISRRLEFSSRKSSTSLTSGKQVPTLPW